MCIRDRFIMWLGEKITDKGIGNGISLIIMIGIVARLPHALSLIHIFRKRSNHVTIVVDKMVTVENK